MGKTKVNTTILKEVHQKAGLEYIRASLGKAYGSPFFYFTTKKGTVTKQFAISAEEEITAERIIAKLMGKFKVWKEASTRLH